jgi:hypothetical protein
MLVLLDRGTRSSSSWESRAACAGALPLPCSGSSSPAVPAPAVDGSCARRAAACSSGSSRSGGPAAVKLGAESSGCGGAAGIPSSSSSASWLSDAEAAASAKRTLSRTAASARGMQPSTCPGSTDAGAASAGLRWAALLLRCSKVASSGRQAAASGADAGSPHSNASGGRSARPRPCCATAVLSGL